MAASDLGFLLRAAAVTFATSLRPDDRCSVVIFGEKTKLSMVLKSRTDPEFDQMLNSGLSELNYKEQYTDIPGGFAAALSELREHRRHSTNQAIILVTDGFVDLRDKAQIAGRKQWLQQDLRREAGEGAVRVFGIAFTPMADLQLLQGLGTATKGNYKLVPVAVGFQMAFTEIREELMRPPKPSPASRAEAVEHARPGLYQSTTLWIALAGIATILLASVAAGIVGYRILARRSQQAEMISEDERGALRPSEGVGPALEISRITTIVGREAISDIALIHPTISQPHASIEFREGCFYLRDRRSRSGTFIETDKGPARRVKPMEPELLKHGDTIRFGEVKSFIFESKGGGGTRWKDGTWILPEACYYHSTRPQQEFCPICRRAICAECAVRHPCASDARSNP